MMTENRFPPGWDEERVRNVLEYYESQTEEEAVAEHEAAYEDNPHYTMMDVPHELVPAVRELIAKHAANKKKGAMGESLVRESQRREK